MWAATAAALVATAAVAEGCRWGFTVWIATNTVFAVDAVRGRRWHAAILWTAYTALAIRGALR